MTNVYRCSDRQERERALGLAATLINRGGVVLAPADSSYATLGTVSVRMPSSALLLELLERTGPVAAMSANRLGLPAPTSLAQAEQVLGELEALDLILDDGELTPSPPSSIVDLTSSTPTLVRAGGVTVDQIRAVIRDLVVLE